MATRILVTILVGWFWVGWGWVRTAYAAEARPIKELPRDVLRWSTLWSHIPRQMVDVGREEGVVSALTWGPVRGTAVMVQKTGDEVWSAVKPAQNTRQGVHRNDPVGAILRYEF